MGSRAEGGFTERMVLANVDASVDLNKGAELPQRENLCSLPPRVSLASES